MAEGIEERVAKDGAWTNPMRARCGVSIASSISCSTLSSMASSTSREKTRENRLRRMAERQGLQLVKSRRRDERAIDYGMYMLVDPSISGVVAGTAGTGRPNFTLDDVENYLTQPDD